MVNKKAVDIGIIILYIHNMISTWAAIGIIVGLLLGLTGAGGAVIAVPLFVYLVETSIHAATVLSLIVVLSGALLNWIFQYKRTDYQLSGLLFTFSALGSYAFTPLKSQASQGFITALFLGVTVWSLFSLWKKKKGSDANPTSFSHPLSHRLLKGSIGGFALGGLITMTGLGGGVMLMPLLKGAFRMPLSGATATSLLTIFASSAFSVWLQRDEVSTFIELGPALTLIGGTVAAAFAAKWISDQLQPTTLDRLRLGLVSVVILISAGSLIIKTVHPGEPAYSTQEVQTMSMRTVHMRDLKDIYLNLSPTEKILDVRTPQEFAEGHVPGAMNIDHESVVKYATELSKYDTVYVYCRSGKRAESAASELSAKGLKNMILVKNSGMVDWSALGFPEQ